jgi:hypothetical protein
MDTSAKAKTSAFFASLVNAKATEVRLESVNDKVPIINAPRQHRLNAPERLLLIGVQPNTLIQRPESRGAGNLCGGRQRQRQIRLVDPMSRIRCTVPALQRDRTDVLAFFLVEEIVEGGRKAVPHSGRGTADEE